jgi:hypothetical protein
MTASPAVRRALWIARIFVIWLSATVALASAAVHSGSVMRPFVTPHYDGGLIFAAGFLLSLLVGLSVDSPKWAGILAAAMCATAAAIYGGVIYAPVWLDITETTVAFQNTISQQVLLVFLWAAIPSLAGALAGNFGGAGLRQRHIHVDDHVEHSWWDRQQQPAGAERSAESSGAEAGASDYDSPVT